MIHLAGSKATHRHIAATHKALFDYHHSTVVGNRHLIDANT